MSRHHSHLNTAKTVLLNYDGQIPFAQELKGFFSGQKKYGSKDRRQIRHLCYSYFRAVRVLSPDLSLDEKIIRGYFLCTPGSNPFITDLKPEWSELSDLSSKEKFEALGLDIENLFPFIESVEESIEKLAFEFSHFEQPNLFVRIRPNNESAVIEKLDRAMISYTQVENNCIELSNTTKIEDILKINKEVVIQDFASQKVGSLLDEVKERMQSKSSKLKVWDCCAASGGKTILAIDKFGKIDITVSDVRDTILRNLKKRLQQAQIIEFKSKQIDLTNAQKVVQMGLFDLIISDVPCTGSGTWGRTPERLNYFSSSEIDHYSSIQKEITANIQSNLKPDGFLLYITCSVYQQENSDVVNSLVSEHGLELVKSQVIKGYTHKADTMYAALLQKK